MKKFLFILTGILLCIQQGQAQQSQTWTEDFDGSLSGSNWIADPSNFWIPNTVYYLPGSSATNPKSYLGLVPNRVGDSTTLVTDIYNCTSYEYVYLRFSHICKIASSDALRIEYRTERSAGVWDRWAVLPGGAYEGSGNYRNALAFNATSYPDWQAGNNMVLPAQTWWKEELFDLRQEAGFARIQFRFVIKHGTIPGTQVSLGWFLENFNLVAANYQIAYPTVQILTPLVKDTVYSTGPFKINAKVKTNSYAPIKIPFLKYTATHNGQVIVADSIEMTPVRGDSLWEATIPQFELGTKVIYSVAGRDTLGNEAIANSEYIITIPPPGGNIILQDGGTRATDYYPFFHNYGYARSMALYVVDEIGEQAVGLISSIALRLARVAPGSFPMKIWVKTVPASKTTWNTTADNIPWATLTSDATLVYDGNFHFSTTGWVDIPLDQFFFYNRTENLVIMFEQNCSSSGTSCAGNMGGSSTYPYYYNKTLASSETRLWIQYSDNYPPYQGGSTNYFYCYNYRPDMRINVIGGMKDNGNSVALHSINMAMDTVNTNPNLLIPIVVTVKNKGALPLNSATISYSINGVHQKDTLINFTPALPWDYTKQITIGSYKPRPSQSDDIKIWIKLPNGQYDSLIWDDTLTKRIYGRADLIMEFTQTPLDTVYATGPYDIKARVFTVSGAALTSAPSLLVTTMFEGITTYDTLPMQAEANNIYTVQIAKKRYGSYITYTLQGSDTVGNEIELIGNYYITVTVKKIIPYNGYVEVGNGTSTSATTPYAYNYNFSYSRNYYKATEIDSNRQGGIITSIGYYKTSTATSNVDNVSFYFKATTDSANTSYAYIDPVTDGATLVWGSATASVSGTGWVTFNLQTPFNLPPDMNLLVYCNDQDGSYSGNGDATFRYTTAHTNSSVYVYGDGTTFPPTTNTNRNANRPNARFYIRREPVLAHSVALTAINSPGKVSLAATPTMVKVTLQNKGTSDMDSCQINWTVNGIPMPTTVYKRTLWADFSDTITLQGFYTPTLGKQDTIVVTVSLPNDVTDTNTFDDKLTVITLGCSTPLSGILPVGTGETYTSIASVLNSIRNCGVGDDLVLSLKNGEYKENIDLTNISELMQGYSLTMRSASGKKDSVTIRPETGRVVILGNTRNVVFKDITFNGAVTSQHVIDFASAANNIVFENCVIRGSRTTSTSTNANCIQKSTNAEFSNISIKHCLIDGGYSGININIVDAAGRSRSTNVFIDSNIISNQYYYGIYGSYLYPKSISYNMITSRTGDKGATWYGLYINEARNIASRCRIVGNNISADTGINTTLCGIYMNYIDTALVANNEIYLHSSAGTTRGFYIDYPRKTEYLHNTVLLTGTGGSTAFQAFYWYTYANTTYSGTLKNNVLVANGGQAASTYAIYLSANVASYQSNYQFDYNNYSSSGTNVGYAGTARIDMPAWLTNMPADMHSVSIPPSFVNSSMDLKLTNYTGMTCPVLPNVTEDIAGKLRVKYTTMGAHEGTIRYNNDASPVQILGLDNGVGAGQPHPIEVVVVNKGWDTLKAVEMVFFIDNDSITTLSFSGLSLALEELDTLALGTIPVAYTYAGHTAKVVMRKANGVADQQAINDTARFEYLACVNPVTGTVRIGASNEADYPNLASALLRMNLCGISGKVTILLEADTNHKEAVDFSKIRGTSADTLEITSLSGKADSVILASSAFVIKTGDLSNLYIKNITIKLIGEGYGILLGAGNNVEISGCKINLDTTLAKNMTGVDPGLRHVAIYKPENSGIANNGRILKNVITGGYNPVLIVGGDTNTHGVNWIFDSNTVQKGYVNSIVALYTDFLSISNNYCVSMSNSSYAGSEWCGLDIQHSNVQVIQRNRVHGQGRALTYPYGMFFSYLNANTTPAAIYNNEILLAKTGTSYLTDAFTFASSSGNIYHNSIAYVTEASTSASSLIYLIPATNSIIDIKNNNLFAARSYAIYIESNTGITADYNNYYTGGTYLGYYGTTAANLTAWQSLSGQDAHSASIRPEYRNLQQSMEVINNFDNILCPLLPAVAADINNTSRQYIRTIMGAYNVKLPDTSAVRLNKLLNFPTEAIVNQQFNIDVEVMNLGGAAVDSILFAYSFNNGVPHTYLWKPATSFVPLSSPVTLNIGSLKVVGDTSIKVWIARANGVANTLKDTVSGAFKVLPLAEFAPPLKDTLFNKLLVDVNVKIATLTGAPVTAPKLYMVKEAYGNTTRDTIVMVLNNGLWTAPLSPQYYGTKIVYWLSVADNIGNNVHLMDSVYIMANLSGRGGGMLDTVIIGTGTSTTYNNPYNYLYNFSYSRNYYMSYEVDAQHRGGTITSIAFYKTSAATSNVDSVSFYLKAVTDSINSSTAYIDPVADGATLVWGSTRASATGTGWLTFTLNTPFYLPPGMNLLLYCNNKDGSWSGNGDATFRYTATGKNTSVYCYADGTTWPPISGQSNYTVSLTGNRPNLRITKEGFEPYPGSDLALLSVVSPVNDPALFCEPSNLPVQIRLGNLGANDYDFTANSITIGYEVMDPLQALYKGTFLIDTGELASGKSNIIELIPSIPILAGVTTIKAWLNNPDAIMHDDTVSYTYRSTKLYLPIDEYFSRSVLPFEFKSTPEDTSGWVPHQPHVSATVQPVFGSGILRYAGSKGTTAKLATSYQIDMYGAINPKLEFWYYHDNTLPELDNSYTDVYVVADGVSYRELNLLKRNTVHGWTQYTVNLSAYTTAQCVLIEFESMNKFDNVQQYIDRIHITSEQDLEITKVLVTPQITACDFKKKDIRVIISTKTAQAINFADYPTARLAVEIPGRATAYHSLSDTLQGRTSDTILIASNVDFSTGLSQIKAYLTVPVDVNSLNDTAVLPINIAPGLSVITRAISGGTSSCVLKGSSVQQTVTVKNTGNMDIPAIELILNVIASSPQYIYKSLSGTLSPGDSVTVTLDNYAVPSEVEYFVNITAYMSCDSAIANHSVMLRECVEMDDLSLLRFVRPEAAEIDSVGQEKVVAVHLKNGSDMIDYHDVVISAVIEANGAEIERIRDVIPVINYSDSTLFIFTSKYTVPDEPVYTLKVYVNSVDKYAMNDTISILRITTSINGLSKNASPGFILGQNIPNPANNNTMINYSIPESGEVIFRIHSMNGQLLYNKAVQPESGTNSIEINTSGLSAGIYVYSMEFKGQRITKRMSIKR